MPADRRTTAVSGRTRLLIWPLTLTRRTEAGKVVGPRLATQVALGGLLVWYVTVKSIEISDRSLLVLLNGLTAAALYFLMASGFTLLFGVVRVTNLAHGGTYLLGGYVALSVQRATGNWLAAMGLGFLFSGGIGIALYLLLRRLRGEGLRETMVTLGATIVMADQALAQWGGVPSDLDPPVFLQGSLPLPGSPLLYPKFRLGVIGLAVIAGLVLWLLLYRTRLGMIIRAGVDDQDMVSIAGIRVELVFCAVFVLAGSLAGMAGVAGGTYLSLAQGEDNRILLASLIVVIAGGLGSLRGAAAASVLVGLVEAFAQTHHAILSVLITFGTLIAVLVLRPHGLFGQPLDARH